MPGFEIPELLLNGWASLDKKFPCLGHKWIDIICISSRLNLGWSDQGISLNQGDVWIILRGVQLGRGRPPDIFKGIQVGTVCSSKI